MQSSNLKQSYIAAAVASVICGLLAHGHILANIITNHDNMPVVKGCGDGLSFGRWMWSVWNKLQLINTPWLNGMVNIILLTLCAILLVYIFQIGSPVRAALIGGVFITATANTTLYLYCQLIPIYSLAIFLSIFALYMLKKYPGWRGNIAFVVCVVLSLGAYQAYFALTATCLLLDLAVYIYFKTPSLRKLVKQGLYYLVLLVISMVGYWGVTRCICMITNTSMASYQGFDSIGLLSGQELTSAVIHSYVSFFGANYAVWNSTICRLVDILSSMIWVLGAGFLIYQLILKKKFVCSVCLSLVAVLFPVSSNIVYFYGADFVHSLMLYGNVFLLISIFVFLPDIVKEMGKIKLSLGKVQLIAVLTCAILMIISNCLIANQTYFSQEKRQNAAISYWRDVVSEIKDTDGYTFEMPIALVGYNSDYSIRALDSQLFQGNIASMTTAEQFLNFPIYHDWLRPGFFLNQIGFYGNFESFEKSSAHKTQAEIQRMPLYPSKSSVAIVNDVLVVHFSND